MTTLRPQNIDDQYTSPLDATRRGAHRARPSAVTSLLPALAVVLVVVAVAAIGYVMFGGDSGGDTGATGVTQSAPATNDGPTATGDGAQQTQPADDGTASGNEGTDGAGEVDRAAEVAVLNNTGTSGLARRGSDALKAKGWTSLTVGNYSPRGAVKATTVYYAEEDQAATAQAVADDLGVGGIERSATIAKKGITLVLADDFTP